MLLLSLCEEKKYLYEGGKFLFDFVKFTNLVRIHNLVTKQSSDCFNVKAKPDMPATVLTIQCSSIGSKENYSLFLNFVLCYTQIEEKIIAA